MGGRSGVSWRHVWIAGVLAVLGFAGSAQAQAVPPVVACDAALNLAVGVTALRGNLATNGGAATLVRTYWGEADGGTDAAAWDHVVTNGVLESGAFSTNIAGLVYGVLYHWRVSAQNEAGTAWAPATRSFTSASPFGKQGPDLGWAYQAWTGDATSGVSSEGAKTCAVGFNGPGTTINGVAFDAHSGTTASGAGWTMGGAASALSGDANDLTRGGGGSATLAKNFIYNGKPRTFTVSGLTPGTRYQTTFFSVGWDNQGQRFQTFSARGVEALIDQDSYGNDKGIAITYCFDADANGSMDYTITPQTDNSFHAYGLFNRAVKKNVIPIAASPATAITATAATLNATLNCTGAVLEVRAYWGPSDGGEDEGGWANSASVGVYTNLSNVSLAFPVSGLPSSRVCFFTFQSLNAATNLWAAESLSFHTPGIPQVAIAAADQVTDATARLNGALDVVGDAFVHFTWGESGGALSNTNVVGTIASGNFSAVIDGLQAGTSYDCQAWATNAYGAAQSSVTNFTTLSAPLTVWDSVSSGPWTDPATWGTSIAPKAGGTVTVNAGHVVTLGSSTPALASVAVNGTLSFSNWDTTLTAADVTVASGGIMTLSAAFANNQMSNNIVIVCSNLTLATGGKLDVVGKGYSGGNQTVGSGPGYGANVGAGWGGGAGHGGHAYKIQAGGAISYGSATAPVTPGSGGYGTYGPGAGRGGKPSFTCASVLANKSVIVCNAQAVDGGAFTVNGSARLENLANFASYGGLDPSPTSVVVRVAGTLELDATSSIHPWSHPTTGGSATYFVRKLIVPAGAQINADARGFRGGLTPISSGMGPGKGAAFPNQQATGGGYGGRGGGCTGNQPNPGGIAYGDEQAPDQPGSGGGYGFGNVGKNGGYGGGLVAIEANTIILDGIISANGGNGPENTAGGGSGGGIRLRVGKLEGFGGVIRANGGNKGWDDGGGGGGRIAVWRQTGDPADFTCTATRGDTRYPTGSGSNEDGTVFWGLSHPTETTLVVR